MFFKGVHELFPVNISDRLVLVRDCSTYATRAADTLNLKVPHVKLKVCEQNFFYQGPIEWNQLGEELKSTPSYNSFKSRVSKLNF